MQYKNWYDAQLFRIGRGTLCSTLWNDEDIEVRVCILTWRGVPRLHACTTLEGESVPCVPCATVSDARRSVRATCAWGALWFTSPGHTARSVGECVLMTAGNRPHALRARRGVTACGLSVGREDCHREASPEAVEGTTNERGSTACGRAGPQPWRLRRGTTGSHPR